MKAFIGALATKKLGLIPPPAERDSRGGFPNRLRSDSPWQTTEVCHVGGDCAAGGLRRGVGAGAGEAVGRCGSGAPAAGACGGLRRRLAERRRGGWRGWVADVPRLGAAVQR